MSSSILRQRVARCAERMRQNGLDAILLTKPANMYYLTGDGRLCAYVMVSSDGQVALGVPMTDVEDVRALASYDHLSGFADEVGMIHGIAHDFGRFGIQQGAVGLEHTFLTQSMMAMVTHPHAKPEGVAPRDCTAILSQLRMVKDSGELERIRAAARVACIAMEAAIAAVRPGATESEVAGAAELAMRQSGAEAFWRTYVSSGPRTSIAHGIPTLRRIQDGDLVMIDVHPIVEGYSADICRTMCAGVPTDAQQSAYDLYLRAQQATIAQVRAGARVGDLESALHAVIREAGHGEHLFGPPIHGVGIEFEEAPLPPGHAFFHGEKAAPPLPARVVLAVGNCGLFLGAWGVRVEDTVIVGEEGPEVLTRVPYRLTP